MEFTSPYQVYLTDSQMKRVKEITKQNKSNHALQSVIITFIEENKPKK